MKCLQAIWAPILHCKATNTGLVYHMACQFTPQMLLVLAPIHRGMARLSSLGWLVKYQDGMDVNQTRKRHLSQY